LNISRLQVPQQQANNDRKELREVTELLNSYQNKFVLYNEEINLLKQETNAKDKILEQFKLQLKNLKRSRSLEPTDRQKRNSLAESGRQQRSASVDPAQALNRQVDIAYDEIRLLKNKISRLEDDLLFVTQVCFRYISTFFFRAWATYEGGFTFEGTGLSVDSIGQDRGQSDEVLFDIDRSRPRG
jgi:hypothetical protein